MKLQQYRKNINRLKGQIQADTTLNQSITFGVSVWWTGRSPRHKARRTKTTLTVAETGAELLGGEANLQWYYSSLSKFNNRSINYYWRWVDNEKRPFVDKSGQNSPRPSRLSTIPFRESASPTLQPATAARLANISLPISPNRVGRWSFM